MPLPNRRNSNTEHKDLSAPLSPTKGLFDLSTHGAQGTFNLKGTEGSTRAYTPVSQSSSGSPSRYPGGGWRADRQQRSAQRREDKALSAYQARGASRAMASSYTFKMPKTKSARPSGVGMRNNAATLG